MKKILVFLSLCIFTLVSAQPKPINPVEVIIPFPPGGGADIAFKNLQGYAAKKDIKLIPLYKPGADGIIAANSLLKDRSKITKLALFPAATLGAVLFKDPSTEYRTISGLRNIVFGIAVRTDSNIRDINDLQLKINSGTDISFAFGAPGQLNIIEQYLELAKIYPERTPVLVPYKGTSPAIIDVLGGSVSILTVPLITIDQHIEAGKLRLLATVGETTKYSNVPSLTNIYKNWKQYDMFGIISNVNIPPEEAKFWTVFFKTYLADAEVLESFEKEFTTVAAPGPDAYNSTVKENVKVLRTRELRR